MNKIRILGVIITFIGVVTISFFENEIIDFVSGLLVGFGVGIIVIGQISFKKYKK
jgi:hypothetical protein